LVLKPENIVGV
jgi:steroid delta-isomerase-like uncharacterized protein